MRLTWCPTVLRLKVKPRGDLRVGQALGHELGHLGLAHAEPSPPDRRRPCKRTRGTQVCRDAACLLHRTQLLQLVHRLPELLGSGRVPDGVEDPPESRPRPRGSKG